MTTDTAATKQRIRRKINQNWKFLHDEAAGAQTTVFDDRAWNTVDLPHDYSLEHLPAGRPAIGNGPHQAVGMQLIDVDTVEIGITALGVGRIVAEQSIAN